LVVPVLGAGIVEPSQFILVLAGVGAWSACNQAAAHHQYNLSLIVGQWLTRSRASPPVRNFLQFISNSTLLVSSVVSGAGQVKPSKFMLVLNCFWSAYHQAAAHHQLEV
jgi:hypothetical protein